MSIKRPRWGWIDAALHVLLSKQAMARQRFKDFLPDLKVIVNGKRLFGLAVGKRSRARDRVYMFPVDVAHMYCPHCDGSIPTHDILLALRPEPLGNSQLFLVEWEGRIGLINERDYNPVAMRMATPGRLPEEQDSLENWSGPFYRAPVACP